MTPAASNALSPKKLVHTKWTAVEPRNKDKHFLVTRVVEPEPPGSPVVSVEIEAVPAEKWSGRDEEGQEIQQPQKLITASTLLARYSAVTLRSRVRATCPRAAADQPHFGGLAVGAGMPPST